MTPYRPIAPGKQSSLVLIYNTFIVLQVQFSLDNKVMTRNKVLQIFYGATSVKGEIEFSSNLKFVHFVYRI